MFSIPAANGLMYADWEATDTDRVAPGADTRFTIFPVAESTHVHNLFSVVAPDRFLGKTVFRRSGHQGREPIPRADAEKSLRFRIPHLW